MKITLNLSPPASARDRYAIAWWLPVALVALGALVFLCRASLRQYREYLAIQHQLSDVELRAGELQMQGAAIRKRLEDPASRKLLHEAHYVNKLIDQRQLSFSEISARLAGLLPEDAHLTNLTLTPPKKPGDDYLLRMGITAKGEDPVETFMNDLEDAPDFKDVSIINQGFQEENASGPEGQQVNLICTARYLPGAEEAYEKTSEEADAAKKKSEAGKPAAGEKSQKAGGKSGPPAVKSTSKGAGNSGAQESTTNRQPHH